MIRNCSILRYIYFFTQSRVSVSQRKRAGATHTDKYNARVDNTYCCIPNMLGMMFWINKIPTPCCITQAGRLCIVNKSIVNRIDMLYRLTIDT